MAPDTTDIDDVDRWRREFPILANTVYMISNSLGAMPAAAADSLAEYAREQGATLVGSGRGAQRAARPKRN